MQPLPPRLPVVIAITITAGAILLALAAASVARSFYVQRAELRLNPINMGQYSGDNAALPNGSVSRVVFFGDSRITRWNPRPDLTGLESIWRGIDGETTSQMKYRFASDVVALNPGTVVIQAGINDLVAGAVLDRLPQATSETAENLLAMSRSAIAAGARVHLLTVIRPSRPPLLRRLVWSDDIYGAVADLNERLRSARQEGLQVLDADAELGDGRHLRTGYAADTLHLTPAGYAALNRRLTEVLQY